MTMERALRGFAGMFVLISLILAYFVNPKWLWFTAFVGLNLFQSAFTNWCPMMWVLKKCGVK
ncbi:MAG: rhodanese [Omnitrophica WOR_2 bacterium RIFCSPLOWO2_12_FULL_51_24]|nr:MAG: rhodanese [Omnitrophica WOR_2 bacterium RIFCSPHIGHO2_01_FULL_49_10]OGX41845.1 MAG: rhodanese [Omnitrophica WOR_2 bacterium RIFCSPLOWO2_12_FULL_51_24]